MKSEKFTVFSKKLRHPTENLKKILTNMFFKNYPLFPLTALKICVRSGKVPSAEEMEKKLNNDDCNEKVGSENKEISERENLQEKDLKKGGTVRNKPYEESQNIPTKEKSQNKQH